MPEYKYTRPAHKAQVEKEVTNFIKVSITSDMRTSELVFDCINVFYRFGHNAPSLTVNVAMEDPVSLNWATSQWSLSDAFFHQTIINRLTSLGVLVEVFVKNLRKQLRDE
jgi:hypothetical protein